MSERDADSVSERPDPSLIANRRTFISGALAMGGASAGVGLASNAAGMVPNKGGAVSPRLFSFVGGTTGGWSVVSNTAIVGDALPAVERLDIVAGSVAEESAATWVLRGVTSNERYVTRMEKDVLVKKQAALGRPESTLGALIPIRKSAKWWALTQDERRELLEDKSQHIVIGLKYLPDIARRLHHCRDLAEAEPFDFLTLFDYAKRDASAFDDLVAALRATEEWKFVEREVDIRLVRAE